ncbi:MAG TPA: hypothetical protein DEG47_21395, partial [Cyanobacteria bacterium UBA11148]|nr:hypothetical protein [Cyanobacteria bacterium UBA11148]
NHCGRPAEYFHPDRLEKYLTKDDAKSLRDYLSGVLIQGTSSNGIFGIKMHWEHFQMFLNLARKYLDFQGKTDLEILSLVFPNPRFIYIWRRDLVRQAVSTEIAYQTGNWVKQNKSVEFNSRKKLVFKPLNIYRYKQGLKVRNQRWKKFFDKNSVEVYEVVYEDFIELFEKTILEIVDFLDIQPVSSQNEIKISLQRQSNEINERWCQYYNYIPENMLRTYGKIRATIKSFIKA